MCDANLMCESSVFCVRAQCACLHSAERCLAWRHCGSGDSAAQWACAAVSRVGMCSSEACAVIPQPTGRQHRARRARAHHHPTSCRCRRCRAHRCRHRCVAGDVWQPAGGAAGAGRQPARRGVTHCSCRCARARIGCSCACHDDRQHSSGTGHQEHGCCRRSACH